MAVRRDGNGWYFVIDLPRGEDDRRRQLKRRGFKSEKAAKDAERAAKEQFRRLELNADGTVAAELGRWLDERELDMSVTGVSSYRDYIRAYVTPHIGHLQMHTLGKQVVHDLYKNLLKGGGAAVNHWPPRLSARCTGFSSRRSRTSAWRSPGYGSPVSRGSSSTAARASGQRAVRNHPRVRGEHEEALITMVRSRDHPRVRGEHMMQASSRRGHRVVSGPLPVPRPRPGRKGPLAT